MRILHVVTAFPRSPDDVIVPWLVELLERLRAAGHDVEVFTASYGGMPDQQVRGIPVHRFRYFLRRWERLTHDEAAPDRMKRSLLYRSMAVAFVLAGMVAIWRLSRRERYDIIHIHWPFPLALFGWAAQRARPARPPRLVTTFYGVELRWVKTAMPLFRGFLRWAARRSDAVVAISSYTAAELRELVDMPIEVIPYTTSLPDPEPVPTGQDATGPVLFVGRLVERKGVAQALEAIAKLGPNGPRLEIVGEGPERPALVELAARLGVADRVVFRGRIPAAELQASYARAAVCVLPSIQDARGDTEGLGVVLLEAMNHGTPVVASRIGGIPDIVEDGKSGLLVPPADADALAAAIRRLIDDPALARRLGEAGRRRLQERFSWRAIVQRWLDLYAGVALQPATPELATPKRV
jgi:glycosyltransferase involved in cell wall biosynthesis